MLSHQKAAFAPYADFGGLLQESQPVLTHGQQNNAQRDAVLSEARDHRAGESLSHLTGLWHGEVHWVFLAIAVCDIF